jgi:hypothetical protein
VESQHPFPQHVPPAPQAPASSAHGAAVHAPLLQYGVSPPHVTPQDPQLSWSTLVPTQRSPHRVSQGPHALDAPVLGPASTVIPAILSGLASIETLVDAPEPLTAVDASPPPIDV